jgi:hypothetical protein
MERVSGLQQAVEVFEHTTRDFHLGLRADQTNLVAPGVRVDAELLLQDAKSPVPLAVELGRGAVVIEDQGLAGAGG